MLLEILNALANNERPIEHDGIVLKIELSTINKFLYLVVCCNYLWIHVIKNVKKSNYFIKTVDILLALT